MIIFQTDGAIKIIQAVIALDTEPHKSVIAECLAVRGAFRMENKNRAKQTNKQNRFRYECETEKQTGISHMTG